MCYVRSIYSLFSSPDMYWNSCRCFVAVFQFFPVMFPVKCKIPPGELHLSFLWEYSLWFDVLLSPVCTALHPHWCAPLPLSVNWIPLWLWEVCLVQRWDVFTWKQQGQQLAAQRTASLGPVLRSRKSSRKFPQPLPLRPPSLLLPGHLVSAKILSSNTINIIMLKQKKKKPYIKLGLGTDFSHRERKRPPPSGASRVLPGI